MEGDFKTVATRCGTKHFNPLPPHGGRRTTLGRCLGRFDFNPLPPHGGRLVTVNDNFSAQLISIHSLRMEGDVGLLS